MLLFKQRKPFCKAFKIILHKAHIYQVLLSTFSIFHAEMSQKVVKRRIHDYTLTQGSIHETLLETHTIPASSEWETINVDHVNNPHACQHKLESECGREGRLQGYLLPPRAVASLRPSS